MQLIVTLIHKDIWYFCLKLKIDLFSVYWFRSDPMTVCAVTPMQWQCGVYIELWVHTEQWGSSASTAGILRLKPYQQSCSRAELTPAWPFFGKEPLLAVCDAGSKGRGEGNHSHILSLCTLIHRGSWLYTLIWPRQGGEAEQKKGRERERGKQKVFIFLYICKGRICGTRVKEQRLPPVLCLKLDLVKTAAICLWEPDSGPTRLNDLKNF